MARDELVHELQLLGAARTLDDIRTHFDAIHVALADIVRKRSRFLEDAFGAVLRHIQRIASPAVDTSDDEDSNENDNCYTNAGLLHAVELCLAFAAPLLPSAEQQCSRFDVSSKAPAGSDSSDVTRERAVCVAFLLHVLRDQSLSAVHRDAAAVALRQRIALLLVNCGVALETIFVVSRFQQSLAVCQEMLLPPATSDEDDSDDGDSDEDDVDATAAALATHQTAAAFGLDSVFTYFCTPRGQEFTFAAWSVEGAQTFAFTILVESVDKATPLTAVIAPSTWLFLLTPLIERYLHSTDARTCGIELLMKILALVPDASISLHVPAAGVDNSSSSSSSRSPPLLPSFQAHCAALATCDWLSPLVQLVTNVMVTRPDAAERAQALAVLRSLVATVADADRFAWLAQLVRACPYANVAAVLVDFVRASVVRAFSASAVAQDATSPFTTKALGALIHDVLTQASERDLVLQADLIASVASLVRFLCIRDTTNHTGVRSTGANSIAAMLERIQRRVGARLQEATPPCAPSDDPHTMATAQTTSYHAAEEFNRLQILDAVLQSTIESVRV